MIVSIGSDHAGFDQKTQLVHYLQNQGHTVIDRGCHSAERADYPDYAVLVARDVADGSAQQGVLVCGTGIGMCVAANKVPGVRAANITAPDFAALAREHNDANVLTLSGRFVDLDVNKRILDQFISTDFGGGRHAGRVEKIARIEDQGA